MTNKHIAMSIWSKNVLECKTRFDKLLNKVRIISANDGKCTAELTINEEHSNSVGTLHGGLSATIVDCISQFALVTHKNQNFGASVDLHMTYLKAAGIGETVVIEANTLKLGKTLAYFEVHIRNKKDNSIVAKGSHTIFVGHQ